MNEVLPPEVLIGIAGEREVGARLASHPDSTRSCSPARPRPAQDHREAPPDNLARLTLELGGNDAGIVLPGTDPQAIAENLFWGAFINTGQTCAALKRLYVHDSIYEDVVAALADWRARCPMGNGLDEQNVLGPLQNGSSSTSSAARRRRQGSGGADRARRIPATDRRELLPGDDRRRRPDGVALVDEEQFGPALP